MKWIGTYILKGKTPIPCGDIQEWAKWFEAADRRVALTLTSNGEVSTVFLGVDHAFGHGQKQLFETMVFGGMQDGLIRRCATWNAAMQIHKAVVELVHHKIERTSTLPLQNRE